MFNFMESKRFKKRSLKIMHDNSKVHVFNLVKSVLESWRVETIKQPPYSPDFNLMDRYIFRNF